MSFIILMHLLFLPVAIYIYIIMLNQTKPKKNLVMGVTLPYDHRDDPEVLEMCRRFKKEQTVYFVILIVSSFGLYFFNRMALQICYLMLWIMLCMILPLTPYIKYNKRLTSLKRKRGWSHGSQNTTVVNLQAAQITKLPIRLRSFAIPLAISFLPIAGVMLAVRTGKHLGTAPIYLLISMMLVNSAIILLFMVTAKIIDRQRTETVDNNLELSIALTNIRRHNWTWSWVYASYATAAISCLLPLCFNNSILIILVYTLYTTAIMIIMSVAELKTRRLQQSLTQQSGHEDMLDEDSYWIYGVIYNNPNDRHIMKNDRVGLGSTINIGRPAGKVIGIISIVCLLIIPASCVWLLAEEYTPKALYINEETLVAHHLKDEYKIALSDIDSVELLEKLPESYRVFGTGMDTVLKGSFTVEGFEGTIKLCLNPKTSPFLVVHTKTQAYILGSDDSSQTAKVFDKLVAAY